MSRQPGQHAKIASPHQARHAKPAQPGPSARLGTAAKAVPATLVVAGAGSALALSGTAAASAAPAASSAPAGPATSAAPASPASGTAATTSVRQASAARPAATRARHAAARSTYTVVAGDTLSGISGRFCGTPADYPSLAHASRIADPNLIYKGETITLACHAAAVTVTTSVTTGHIGAHRAAPRHPVARPARPPQATTAPTGGMSAFESCVISRESGGNPRAVNPASDAGGLFQFLPSTWAALGEAAAYPGGAQTAPVGVQEAAFDKLYAEAGTSPWAPYDGC
jgi:LysM repeat protein